MEKGGVKFKKALTRLLKSKREESDPTSFSKRPVTKIEKGLKILKKERNSKKKMGKGGKNFEKPLTRPLKSKRGESSPISC
jgi:hypothetical protein